MSNMRVLSLKEAELVTGGYFVIDNEKPKEGEPTPGFPGRDGPTPAPTPGGGGGAPAPKSPAEKEEEAKVKVRLYGEQVTKQGQGAAGSSRESKIGVEVTIEF